jgi:hypothetical protein
MSNHPAFWKFYDNLVKHVLLSTQYIIQHLQAGNKPHEALRRLPPALAEKQAECVKNCTTINGHQQVFGSRFTLV